MNDGIYLELRRRAEKRVTVLGAGPLLAFQVLFYGLMLIRSPYDMGIPMLATIMSFCIVVAMTLLYRRRTAANKAVRRRAIDDTLTDALDMGWPLDNPTPRELRLLAALLDDDMDTRAGYGRVMVWSSLLAAILWPITYFAALSATFSWTLYDENMVMLFGFWLVGWGGMTLVHRRARRASDQRVQAALDQAGDWSMSKRKRPAEAPWWNEADEAPEEKPKTDAWAYEADVLLGDDGEIDDGMDSFRPRRRLT